MKKILSLLLLSGSLTSLAQTQSILTTSISSPGAIATDPNGYLFVRSFDGGGIYKVSASGQATLFVSPGSSSHNIASDAIGNLYLPNSGTSSVIKVSPAGAFSTFAANISAPLAVTVGSDGSLYVGCYSPSSGSIIKVTPAGVSSVFASGPDLADLSDISYGGDGNLYATCNNTVKKIAPDGTVTTHATQQSWLCISHILAVAGGTVYVSDYCYNDIYVITPGGMVSTFSSGQNLSNVRDMAMDAAGNLVVTSNANNRVVRITSPSLPLPVSITAFAGRMQDRGAVLNWSTAGEAQVSSYTIERSTSGASGFLPVGVQPAAAHHNTGNSYTFFDPVIARVPLFYRLRINQEDGAASYSSIVRVMPAAASHELRVFPNPCSGNRLAIDLGYNPVPESGCEYSLRNNLGQELQHGVLRDRSTELDVSGLTRGVYFLQLANGKPVRWTKQ